MMSRILGAPLGGTIRGGHQGLESFTFSLITPPNCGGGDGSCFPPIVVVALGEPNSPVTCCAAIGRKMAGRNARETAARCSRLGRSPNVRVKLFISHRTCR